MKYKYKPVEVEAVQYDGSNRKEIVDFTKGKRVVPLFPEHVLIDDFDWIVKQENVFYLYPPRKFEEVFEPIVKSE